jgi:hypothetical protein
MSDSVRGLSVVEADRGVQKGKIRWQLITNEQLKAKAIKAYDEHRLTAQQEPRHTHCVYYMRLNDRVCGCAIGVSLPPDVLQVIIEHKANAADQFASQLLAKGEYAKTVRIPGVKPSRLYEINPEKLEDARS